LTDFAGEKVHTKSRLYNGHVLERGVIADQNKDATQNVGTSVSEERIQSGSQQEVTPDVANHEGTTSVEGIAGIDMRKWSPPRIEDHDKASNDIRARTSTPSLPFSDKLADISGLLDKNNLLNGRPPFLSSKGLGLSEPSHG